MIRLLITIVVLVAITHLLLNSQYEDQTQSFIDGFYELVSTNVDKLKDFLFEKISSE